MGAVSLSADADSLAYQAPATPEEFWRRDWVYVLKLTRTLVRDGQEAEDAAADIFTKLLARDVPGMYKPDVVSAHTKRRVTWRAFLSNQVALYCRGKQEQAGRRLYREPLLCDAPAGGQGTRWVELFGGQEWDDYPSLSDSDFIVRVREHLASVPEWPGTVSLLEVFEEIMSQVTAGDKVSVTYLRRRLGVSGHEVHAALGRIREACAGGLKGLEVPQPAVFEVAGLQLSAAEVREAAACLRETKGNQVRRAFTKAGHRLAGCGTKWYLEFAAQELHEYPELKVPKGSHASGHNDQVKTALVHRLERMVSLVPPEAECDVPVPVPEPAEEPESPADILESRLFRLGASPAEVDELLVLAAKAFS